MANIHYSDCSIYNEPAHPAGECDCGAIKARKRWWTYVYRLLCIQISHLQSVLGSRLRILFGLTLTTSNRAPYQNEMCHLFDSNELPHSPLGSNHKREVLLRQDVHDKSKIAHSYYE